uniref:SWIM-type domain-containing protein n=1 Tax=Lactuca sativa TaxID=4236 RepID=A0A9R1W097_LACSA|nr:hypothetical protein LSAT_V11C400226560 [Lactuca sativa]
MLLNAGDLRLIRASSSLRMCSIISPASNTSSLILGLFLQDLAKAKQTKAWMDDSPSFAGFPTIIDILGSRFYGIQAYALKIRSSSYGHNNGLDDTMERGYLEQIGSEIDQNILNKENSSFQNGYLVDDLEESLSDPLPGSTTHPHQKLLMVLSNLGFCKDDLSREMHDKYHHIWMQSRFVGLVDVHCVKQSSSDFVKVKLFKSDQKLLCSCFKIELTGTLCIHCFYVLRMESVESYQKAYLKKRWTKDVVPRYMDTYKIPNVHTKEKKEEIQSIIRELEFAMEFCIDRLVNDLDKLILVRDEMNEKMTMVDNETKNEKSMKNIEVIETLMGMEQKEKVNILPPTLINNKGVWKTKKRMKGKKEIDVEKAKDGRQFYKCGKYIKYGTSEKYDARNCHKFATEGATSNV